MDRRAWQSTDHWLTRIRHDLVTKKNRNQKEIKYAMEDSDLTPKSNGELMFTLDEREFVV